MKTLLIACAFFATTAGAQSLPAPSSASLCDSLGTDIGLLILPEIVAIQKLYPDNSIDEVAEWVGEAMFDVSMQEQLPQDLQVSMQSKLSSFLDLVAEYAEAGCKF